ncbi:methyltransferase domain-containing protein [uncultured Desulfovibrio sp.]|uniref:methyltransferase domain-containing protein n=1 Tax=uncultured Desulfovibrio sp. TaxID=167968 RepID=UPI00261F3C5B|nr:methyltransferase domain-containing protein [uncultured Desulfovibrio sp.]
MKRLYQTEWQHISFTDFAEPSFFSAAGGDFYSAFYARLFTAYASYEALDAGWRAAKRRNAEKIAATARTLGKDGNRVKILSIGCGLGFTERELLRIAPECEIFCHDITETPLRWLKEFIPADHICTGLLPQCLPDPQARFDLIYLGDMDYALDDAAYVGLLSTVRELLTEDGKALICTVSLQEWDAAPLRRKMSDAKEWLHTLILHCSGRQKFQFWGWMRTIGENVELRVHAHPLRKRRRAPALFHRREIAGTAGMRTQSAMPSSRTGDA